MALTAACDSSGKPIQGTYIYGPDWQEEFQSWLADCRPDYFGVTYLVREKSTQNHIFCDLAYFLSLFLHPNPSRATPPILDLILQGATCLSHLHPRRVPFRCRTYSATYYQRHFFFALYIL